MKNLLLAGLILLCKQTSAQPVLQIVAQLGTIKDSVTTVQKILVNPWLIVVDEKRNKTYFTVIGFTLTITDPSGEYILLKNTSRNNYLTKEQTNSIKLSGSGSRLLFTDIRATCPDCRIRALPDLSLEIK